MRRKRLTKCAVALFAVLIVQGSISLNAHSDLPEAEPQTETELEPVVYLAEEELAAYARQVLELVNRERAREGLEPLESHEELDKAARTRAAELEESFGHKRPDGTKWSTVFAEHGLTSKTRAENIAFGHVSPERVVYKLMLSEGHRKNIMNSKYRYMGVGVHQTEDGYLAWEQLFSK